jgi:hypothetical protein
LFQSLKWEAASLACCPSSVASEAKKGKHFRGSCFSRGFWLPIHSIFGRIFVSIGF